MAQGKTTVIFIPGAWHDPDGFDAVIEPLHQAGYASSKVYTPSVIRDGAKPVSSFDPDVAETRKHIQAAVDQGRQVVLVTHSYSGVVGSEAAKGFDRASLAAQGHQDGRGIIHMVYLTAFMLRKGESLSTFTMPSGWIENFDDGSSFPRDPASVFYHDFKSQEKIDQWVSTLKRWSPAVAVNPITHEPWKTIPSTYLTCDIDRAIPIESQRLFVKNALEAGAVDLRVINWKSSHTPFGTRPFEISQIIRSAVENVERGPLPDTR